jgi:hypothetical protein
MRISSHAGLAPVRVLSGKTLKGKGRQRLLAGNQRVDFSETKNWTKKPGVHAGLVVFRDRTVRPDRLATYP